MTNVLVEGGGTLLGSLADAGQIDELHVFVGPKLIGGQHSPSPVAGVGIDRMAAAWQLDRPTVRLLAGDVYLVTRVRH
jgi:diaminohydroxyphosphoribosylaminopyrimidine deaminase/5-amino-6-(5-phosphoribosylamino)uracil reductase